MNFGFAAIYNTLTLPVLYSICCDHKEQLEYMIFLVSMFAAVMWSRPLSVTLQMFRDLDENCNLCTMQILGLDI